MLFLKYLLKVCESEDPQQFVDLISNHERHNCADSVPPETTKGKEPTLHDPSSPRQGLNTLRWHLRLPHPTWEDFAISLSGSHALCSPYPAQHCLQASTQTTILILFRQAARPDTPPAPLNMDIAH